MFHTTPFAAPADLTQTLLKFSFGPCDLCLFIIVLSLINFSNSMESFDDLECSSHSFTYTLCCCVERLLFVPSSFSAIFHAAQFGKIRNLLVLLFVKSVLFVLIKRWSKGHFIVTFIVTLFYFELAKQVRKSQTFEKLEKQKCYCLWGQKDER